MNVGSLIIVGLGITAFVVGVAVVLFLVGDPNPPDKRT